MQNDIFDPVVYSLEENRFLAAHVGEPPIIALRAIEPTVNPAAVRPVLSRVYELMELEKHEPGFSWVGVDAIKTAITTFLAKMAEWSAGSARGRAPRFPSLYSIDARKKPGLPIVDS